MKSNTYKIAFSGITTAVAVVLLVLASYFKVAEYFFYIGAALMIELVLNVCDIKFAFLSYIATSLLGYIFFPGNIISLTTFILFFGLYPIISRLSFLFKKIPFRYIFKLVYFNIVLPIIFFICGSLLFPKLLEKGYLLTLVLGNIGFLLYDLFETQCARLVTKYKKKYIKE